jgi:AcrR family transcriptional regulator
MATADRNGSGASRLPAAERREQLIATAYTVFAERGYRDASMNDIAAAAGVTKPVLYQHFASKKELFRELLADGATQLRVDVANAAGSAVNPREQVEAGFRAFFHFVRDCREAFALMFSGDVWREPEFAREVGRVEDDMAAVITDLIVVEGMPAAQRRILAFGLVGAAQVAARHWIERGLDTDADELAAQLAQLAWSGLRGARPLSR